jgi:hypothetical protein
VSFSEQTAATAGGHRRPPRARLHQANPRTDDVEFGTGHTGQFTRNFYRGQADFGQFSKVLPSACQQPICDSA